jgi:hypothetical protein
MLAAPRPEYEHYYILFFGSQTRPGFSAFRGGGLGVNKNKVTAAANRNPRAG